MDGYGVGGAVQRSPAPYLAAAGVTAKSGFTSNFIKVGRFAKTTPISYNEGVGETLKLGPDQSKKGVRMSASALGFIPLDTVSVIKVDESSEIKQNRNDNKRNAPRQEKLRSNLLYSSKDSGLAFNSNQTSNDTVRLSAAEGSYSKYHLQNDGYVHNYNPCVLISEVPKGWPPEHKDVSAT